MHSKIWTAVAVTTFAIVLLVVCAPLIADKVAEYEKTFEAKQAKLEEKVPAKGKIVYAVKEIPEGTVFKASQLEGKIIERSKIPVDAAISASLVVGRRAKYDIAPGQIISRHDIGLSRR